MDKKKSAKDIAFDKERSKLRSEIRKLQDELNNQRTDISELKVALSEKENAIAEKDDWIERLLGYMDLSKEDLKKSIEREKAGYDALKNIVALGKAFSRFPMV